MVSVTLSIPEMVKRKMEVHDEINWSGFIRKCILEKTEGLEWKEGMLKRLKDEESIINWSVDIQRRSRTGRTQQIKKRGLL